MKNLFTLILALSLVSVITVTAQAALDQEMVLSTRTVVLNVDVSTAKVKLSNAGYATFLVKILVPDLADATLLDHRNAGENAPCIATYGTMDSADVVKNDPGIDKVEATVTLSKVASVNSETKLCEITLHEVIEAKIRGFSFFHDRDKVIATRHIDDCR